MLLEVVVGVPIALAAAWNGGIVDGVISRVLDVLFAFPGILLAILVISLFGAGLRSAVVALAVAHLPYLARITRGAAIRERRLPYVEALELQGFSGIRICARHLTPNLLPLIVAQACVSFGYIMIDLAALSFLGLGVQPPTADWGVMISTGEQSLLRRLPAAVDVCRLHDRARGLLFHALRRTADRLRPRRCPLVAAVAPCRAAPPQAAVCGWPVSPRVQPTGATLHAARVLGSLVRLSAGGTRGVGTTGRLVTLAGIRETPWLTGRPKVGGSGFSVAIRQER